MIKNKIELKRGSEQMALLEWHRPDGQGGHIPLAIEFSDALDPETRQRIVDICHRPVNAREGGTLVKVLPGSSKHFLALPKVLERLGFRSRLF